MLCTCFFTSVPALFRTKLSARWGCWRARGLYWLYSFSAKPFVWLQRLLLTMIVATGVAFVMMVSLAYSVDTIVTWSLPTVPISLWLNALVGGPLLTAITLYAAQWRALAGRFGLLLMAVPFIALAANAVVYIVQGRLLGGVANSVIRRGSRSRAAFAARCY